MIFCDYRENRSEVPKLLAQLGLQVRTANLVTDYIVGDVFVERKTIGDFISSITDGRLFRQVADLANNCKHPLLLLEGGGLFLTGRISPNTIRGVILWIAVQKQVPVLRTFNAYDTACTIRLLAKHPRNIPGKDVELFQYKRKQVSTWQQQVNLLIHIPGIGWQTAKDIVKVFGSVISMSQASDSELINLKCIGKKRLQQIRQFFPNPIKHKQDGSLAEL